MSKIKILDDITISKIAAGEIVERPASIVKELIENSIDANAKNIIVEIKKGGKTYIRVTDDGDGISHHEIDLAFKRHSTSKIQNIDDLNKTLTLGFRGEALASISTISKLNVLTKTENDFKGIQATLEGGKIIDKVVVGCPKGTTMIVEDVFYNIPVRKKFLKSDITESNHISDVVYRLALGNPQVSFNYIKDNKVILKTPGNNDIMSNIYILLGEDFVENLIEINYEDDLIKVHGYISKNNFYRSNRSHQYIFINKRYVKNRHISKLIEDKYKSLIPINKFPVFILFIDVDPLYVDVNIHPTKQEVKFEDQDLIDIAINFAIDLSINKVYYVPNIDLQKKESKSNEEKYENINFLDKPLDEPKKDSDIDIQTLDYYKEDNNIKNIVQNTTLKPKNNLERVKETAKHYTSEKEKTFSVDNLRIIGVAFNTYIIAEDLKNDNLYLIDQHAAHERVMFEKYKNEYENEKIVVQKLLAPKIVYLTNKEANIVKQNIDLLYKLGFEIEEFGLNSVALRGVPVLFGKPDYENILFDVIDNLDLNIKSSYEVRLEKIMKIACCSAVKSGDQISEIEIKSLLKQISKTQNPYTCPHGRPTIIKLTKVDLEKQFKRIM